ncbi:hypothetical protein G6O69_13405 [Pseudenhygromyxa sp. WMMC2535]|uniref:hypothetical protein n=1 Tax=Pseudenhygromyxa sp. WMMC2535 TaxID=2712867 RepID=UPI0015567EE7|nr:hypothetical protein [Pseudenhygromyxa sp. WMMC2535]NVB38832.1 hypothetical protein [Pseudenhygromyxa sp. WMMC2535]
MDRLDISEALALSETEAERMFASGKARLPTAHAILQRLADIGLGDSLPISRRVNPASTREPGSTVPRVLHYHAAVPPTDADRPRPDGVPSEAWWSSEDGEWVLGPKDEAGELHGEIRYWRPDGTLCCVSRLQAGKPHGPFRRFHETGEVSQTGQFVYGELHGLRTFINATGPSTENMHIGARLSRKIARSEYDYDHGTLSATRHYAADGTPLGTDGEPLPSRPEGVPKRAIRNATSGNWVAGLWDGEGRRDGELQVFDAEGKQVSRETYKADVLHGPTTVFYPGTGTKRASFNHVEGALDGLFEQYYRDGTLARQAQLAAGRFAGTLRDWTPDGELTAETELPGSDAPAVFIQAPPEPVLRCDLGELDLDELAALADGPISPTGLARLIALGWGGDESRDGELARVARKLVRERNDEALRAALAETGLDAAPRLLTVRRLERVIEIMQDVPAVDTQALQRELAASGGVGLLVPLERDDAVEIAALESLISGDRLNLRSRDLTRLPPAVRRFPGLRTIDASHNRITELTAEVSEVLLLYELNLVDNGLRDLPDELRRLRDLRVLMLGDNPLERVPDVIPALSELSTLHLASTRLTSLPGSFGELERLRTLWLDDNPLSGLPTSFATLDSLRFLHLGGHPWSSPPLVIFELRGLEELWLASPDLTELPGDIARLAKLERLTLWYSGLTSLPDSLFEMTGLRELRVSNNPLPQGTIERLQEALPDCTIY